MRKTFCLCVAAALFAACSTTPTVFGTDGKPLSKAESERIVRNTIKSRVDNRDFRILVKEMQPLHGPFIYINDDWALEVHGDSIGSILPYFGRAYHVPYGGGLGLHFITRIDEYNAVEPKSGLKEITIKCHTDEESYIYNVEVYADGTSYITVQTPYRDLIRFSGDIDVNDLYLKRIK